MMGRRFGQRSPTSSRNLPPDPVAELTHAVPANDEFLRQWRPTRMTDGAINKARREHSEFFHVPGCYTETTNFEDPPENMSPVNTKIFEVFKETYHKGLVIMRGHNGQPSTRTNDYTFFRFKLMPVDPRDTAQAQDWLLQPLEKCKAKPREATKARMELQTTPKTSTSHSVVFVRTHDSRVTPDMLLDSQAFAQSYRSKAVAKAMTGVQPVSLVHAELLIDAAIEKKIITERMQAQQPLPNFWKLPAEIRGRIYQLAAQADGDIWPVDLKTYHSQHPDLLYTSLSRIFENNNHLTHGNNIIFANGLILPKSVGDIVDPYNIHLRQFDVVGESSDASVSKPDSSRAFTTPSLLRTSKAVRHEVIKTLFVQPTFCFSGLSFLDSFMRRTLDDALSSLRKMRLNMQLGDLLIVFSVARMGMTSSEQDLLGQTLDTLYDLGSGYASQTMGLLPSVGRRKVSPRWEKAFDENDVVFVERADHMRFTHLTLNVQPVRRPAISPPLSFAGTLGNLQPAEQAKQLHLGRLLLVKLVNLTLDFWAQKNGSRPQLTLTWPGDVEGKQLEAVEIMHKVYQTAEVTDD